MKLGYPFWLKWLKEKCVFFLFAVSLSVGWSWETNPVVVERGSCHFGGRPLWAEPGRKDCPSSGEADDRSAQGRRGAVLRVSSAADGRTVGGCARDSQCLLVGLGGLEGETRTTPPPQQSKSLLVKLGLWGRTVQYFDDVTNAGDTTVAKTVGESWFHGIAKYSTTTEVSSGEVGPSWPRARSTPSALDTAVAMPAGEVRPPGVEETDEAVTPVPA